MEQKQAGTLWQAKVNKSMLRIVFDDRVVYVVASTAYDGRDYTNESAKKLVGFTGTEARTSLSALFSELLV